jgi:RNA polymerase sigma-70 factor (ECF subfamily)
MKWADLAIKNRGSGNQRKMAEGTWLLRSLGATLPAVPLPPTSATAPREATPAERVQAIARAELDFVWRLLRRFGLAPADAEDATQEVFLVLSRRIADVEPGKERSFLTGTAVKVTQTQRRTVARRRESFEVEPDERVHPGLDPEALACEKRRLGLLDQAMAELPWELRVPFVLFELQELTMTEIASLLGMPMGTVASRLRRAREEFHGHARRLKARSESAGIA